jgi:outer membrane protein TolC
VGSARAEAAAAARAAAAAARLASRRVADTIEADLAAAGGADRRLSALTPVIDRLPEAERSLAEQFRLGAQSYLVFLDGMARFDDVRLDAVAARHDLLQARLRLAATLNRPDLFPLPDLRAEEVTQ